MSEVYNGKWLLNDEGSEYWNASEAFNSKEEAVAKGKEILKIYNALSDNERKGMSLADFGFNQSTYDNIMAFNVGQVNLATINLNGERFVEMVADDAYEEYGEFAEDYLSDVTKEHLGELEELLHGWFEKHNYMPTFYTVEDISTIVLEGTE